MNKNILSLILFTSILTVSSFAELTKSNGVVTDNNTSLQWQDDYSDNGNTVKYVVWSEAISYCNSLNLVEGDWRLPNINELLSLVDPEKHSPVIKGDVFENIITSPYWSSTTYASNNRGTAWVVHFGIGATYRKNKTSFSFYVRCVRAGE